MGIYICLIGIILFFDKIKNSKYNNKIFWTLVSSLAIVSAIRYDVGTDYMGYTVTFEAIKLGMRTYVEWGYYTVANWVIRLGGDAQIMFALMSFLTSFAFGYTITRNIEGKDRIFALFIYMCAEIYFYSMNAMRQYVAISILLFGFELLKQRKYIKYMITVGLAMLFHTVAIFTFGYMLLVIINDKKDIFKLLNIIVLVSIIFMFIDLRPLIEDILIRYTANTRWENYLTGGNRVFFEERNEASILKSIVPNIIWFLMYYSRQKKQKNANRNFDLYAIGYFIYVAMNNAFYGINIFNRVYGMFEYYIIYLVPYLIKLGKTDRDRKIIKLLIALYYFALTSYAIFYMGSQECVPYQTIFDV